MGNKQINIDESSFYLDIPENAEIIEARYYDGFKEKNVTLAVKVALEKRTEPRILELEFDYKHKFEADLFDRIPINGENYRITMIKKRGLTKKVVLMHEEDYELSNTIKVN